MQLHTPVLFQVAVLIVVLAMIPIVAATLLVGAVIWMPIAVAAIALLVGLWFRARNRRAEAASHRR